MRYLSLVLLLCLLGGCGGSLDVSSWLDQEQEISSLTLEMIGVYLLHTLPPGMEGQFRVTNGLTDTARSFSIDYTEVLLVQGRGIDTIPTVDPKKVPLVDLPNPVYTQSLETQLITNLRNHHYEFQPIVLGQCASLAFLSQYDVVILVPDQYDCIALFRGLGYYVVTFDGDFAKIDRFLEEMIP